MYNGNSSYIGRALFHRKRQEKRNENPRRIIEEMETVSDQYDEEVNSGTSHLPVVKPKLSSTEIEGTTRINIFDSR